MPQLDIFIFFSLMFWFVILFELSHYLFVHWFLPNIVGVTRYRKYLVQQINAKRYATRMESMIAEDLRRKQVKKIFIPMYEVPKQITKFQSDLEKEIASQQSTIILTATLINEKYEAELEALEEKKN
jgi:hypothetical protein